MKVHRSPAKFGRHRFHQRMDEVWSRRRVELAAPRDNQHGTAGCRQIRDSPRGGRATARRGPGRRSCDARGGAHGTATIDRESWPRSAVGVGGTLDRGHAPWGEQAQPMRDWTVRVDVRVKRPPRWRPLSLDRPNPSGRGALGDDPVTVSRPNSRRRARPADPEVLKHAALAEAHDDGIVRRVRVVAGGWPGSPDVAPNRAP
jgi:hypothetical protein